MSRLGERLDTIERRLEQQSRARLTGGLTEPDPGTEERWEAAQVWAHMAEFVRYWREQAEQVIAEYGGQPVAFGRTKTDEARLAAIESGRRRAIGELADETRRGLADLHRFISGLSEQERSAVGRHVTRGEMDVDRLIEHFLLDHLEEHLDQLDRLRAEA